ncbi:heavy-metal-associated domain-containing protein [Gluconobacter sphaericus]|uniref:Copper chaperone CopZ n=1 Tax=Gluconobacter sphaericus NBRC 12467 TaxID=1307951 RepID=A0AA37SH60_9PROT|nr:heavy metal-associated domain-containing protein [Gluconobacter sphaericus]MBF0886144.1 heavy-metal-associated domain-containing protein [Gluconobacter sphaericus]MBS1086850.1 heavy-metal-associated domain-containing protein [Gluconobacter sphaericus]MBS1100770.1 heavy-metal-associated domain-containing protein [Gluconobacter sphaericus]QQX92124.1 heavy-metal-associated domain-containing protein [Gluconobacter sphaericus]GBR55682.1 cation/copper resistance transporter ATPase CopZ [Gluconoba
MVSMVTFKVDGMSCNGCSGKLQSALSNVPGVSSAEVTLDPGLAVIQYDEHKVTPVALQHVVEDVGFDVIA